MATVRLAGVSASQVPDPRVRLAGVSASVPASTSTARVRLVGVQASTVAPSNARVRLVSCSVVAGKLASTGRWHLVALPSGVLQWSPVERRRVRGSTLV